MKIIKIVITVIGALLLLNGALTAINILQKSGTYDGRSMKEILGVDPETATVMEIEKLNKAEVFQLFYAAGAPSFREMKGEYAAQTISVGVMAAGADFFTHNFFGPGRWMAKAFFPFEKEEGWGYNIFLKQDDSGNTRESRTRRMNTWIGTSNIDAKKSFHLDYSPYNSGAVRSMRDEIRKINDSLYIGMGYMGLGGGSINPAPFILKGPPRKWIGIDRE